MTKQLKPIIHARDHLADGADPIRIFQTSAPGDYEGLVLSFPDLRGYWRLGEGTSPYADTSGHVYGPADAVRVAAGTVMTQDLTPGALADNDDGAVQFNSIGGATADYLDAPDPDSGGERRFNFTPSDGSDMTLAGWVKPEADANTFRGGIVSQWDNAGFGNCGWLLGIDWPARTPVFSRRSGGTPATDVTLTGTSLPTDEWSLVVATFSTVDGHKLYINGGLVDSDPSTFTSLPGFNNGPNIGIGDHRTRAAIDEVAVWGDPLTPEQVNSLYTSGTASHDPAGSKVLVPDGNGGTMWGQAAPAAIEPGNDGDYLQTIGGAAEWAPGGGGDPADDTHIWMPLTTVSAGIPDLVWDGDDSLIPTLTPL